jgi:hypothetical protein
MNITSLPTVSDPIYLATISEEFARLEGDVESDADRVWVIVRQATEEHAIARSNLVAKREMKFNIDGGVSEIINDNPRERAMREAWYTLVEVGNLTVGPADKPLPVLAKKPIHNMKFDDFKAEWGKLPVPVSSALHKAVRVTNPDWDWETPKKDKDEDDPGK